MTLIIALFDLVWTFGRLSRRRSCAVEKSAMKPFDPRGGSSKEQASDNHNKKQQKGANK